jgi:hypothetical protein
MTYDTMHTPVAPVTSSTRAESSGIAKEMPRAMPKMRAVSLRWRAHLNLWAAFSTPIFVRSFTSQMSIVWRVGNSMGGSETARYTAQGRRSVCVWISTRLTRRGLARPAQRHSISIIFIRVISSSLKYLFCFLICFSLLSFSTFTRIFATYWELPQRMRSPETYGRLSNGMKISTLLYSPEEQGLRAH